jgi:hypothetical protein
MTNELSVLLLFSVEQNVRVKKENSKRNNRGLGILQMILDK